MASDRVGRRLAEEVTVMNYGFFGLCGALAIASTMTLAAQAPTQPPTTRPQPPAPTQPWTHPADQSPITVAGCLTPWDSTMATAPAGPTATPGDPRAKPGAAPMATTRYVLRNVSREIAAPGPPQAATPTAGTPPPTHPQASQYIVAAGSGVNLAAHVNHQVRLVGTVDYGMTMAHADKPADTPADKATARPGDPAHARATLTATSVTMISATCTSTAQQ